MPETKTPHDLNCLTISELEKLAAERMDKQTRDYYNEGALGSHPGALQLYLFEDRPQSQKLIQRAKKAGYKAVMLTVDTPVLGRRNLEIRNQFALPKHL